MDGIGVSVPVTGYGSHMKEKNMNGKGRSYSKSNMTRMDTCNVMVNPYHLSQDSQRQGNQLNSQQSGELKSDIGKTNIANPEPLKQNHLASPGSVESAASFASCEDINVGSSNKVGFVGRDINCSNYQKDKGYQSKSLHQKKAAALSKNTATISTSSQQDRNKCMSKSLQSGSEPRSCRQSRQTDLHNDYTTSTRHGAVPNTRHHQTPTSFGKRFVNSNFNRATNSGYKTRTFRGKNIFGSQECGPTEVYDIDGDTHVSLDKLKQECNAYQCLPRRQAVRNSTFNSQLNPNHLRTFSLPCESNGKLFQNLKGQRSISSTVTAQQHSRDADFRKEKQLLRRDLTDYKNNKLEARESKLEDIPMNAVSQIVINVPTSKLMENMELLKVLLSNIGVAESPKPITNRRSEGVDPLCSVMKISHDIEVACNNQEIGKCAGENVETCKQDITGSQLQEAGSVSNKTTWSLQKYRDYSYANGKHQIDSKISKENDQINYQREVCNAGKSNLYQGNDYGKTTIDYLSETEIEQTDKDMLELEGNSIDYPYMDFPSVEDLASDIDITPDNKAVLTSNAKCVTEWDFSAKNMEKLERQVRDSLKKLEVPDEAGENFVNLLDTSMETDTADEGEVDNRVEESPIDIPSSNHTTDTQRKEVDRNQDKERSDAQNKYGHIKRFRRKKRLLFCKKKRLVKHNQPSRSAHQEQGKSCKRSGSFLANTSGKTGENSIPSQVPHKLNSEMQGENENSGKYLRKRKSLNTENPDRKKMRAVKSVSPYQLYFSRYFTGLQTNTKTSVNNNAIGQKRNTRNSMSSKEESPWDTIMKGTKKMKTDISKEPIENGMKPGNGEVSNRGDSTTRKRTNIMSTKANIKQGRSFLLKETTKDSNDKIRNSDLQGYAEKIRSSYKRTKNGTYRKCDLHKIRSQLAQLRYQNKKNRSHGNLKNDHKQESLKQSQDKASDPNQIQTTKIRQRKQQHKRQSGQERGIKKTKMPKNSLNCCNSLRNSKSAKPRVTIDTKVGSRRKTGTSDINVLRKKMCLQCKNVYSIPYIYTHRKYCISDKAVTKDGRNDDGQNKKGEPLYKTGKGKCPLPKLRTKLSESKDSVNVTNGERLSESLDRKTAAHILKEHFARIRPRVQMMECELCNYMSVGYTCMAQHRIIHSLKHTVSCKICKITFLSQKSMKHWHSFNSVTHEAMPNDVGIVRSKDASKDRSVQSGVEKCSFKRDIKSLKRITMPESPTDEETNVKETTTNGDFMMNSDARSDKSSLGDIPNRPMTKKVYPLLDKIPDRVGSKVLVQGDKRLVVFERKSSGEYRKSEFTNDNNGPKRSRLSDLSKCYQHKNSETKDISGNVKAIASDLNKDSMKKIENYVHNGQSVKGNMEYKTDSFNENVNVVNKGISPAKLESKTCRISNVTMNENYDAFSSNAESNFRNSQKEILNNLGVGQHHINEIEELNCSNDLEINLPVDLPGNADYKDMAELPDDMPELESMCTEGVDWPTCVDVIDWSYLDGNGNDLSGNEDSSINDETDVGPFFNEDGKHNVNIESFISKDESTGRNSNKSTRIDSECVDGTGKNYKSNNSGKNNGQQRTEGGSKDYSKDNANSNLGQAGNRGTTKDDDDDEDGKKDDDDKTDENTNGASRDMELFSCLVCNTSFSKKQDLMKHLSRIHRMSNLCTLCYFKRGEIQRFANPVSLRNHKLRDHSGDMVQCVCGTKLIDDKMLESHLKKFKCNLKSISKSNMIRCICGKRFENQQLLSKHKKFKCRKRLFSSDTSLHASQLENPNEKLNVLDGTTTSCKVKSRHDNSGKCATVSYADVYCTNEKELSGGLENITESDLDGNVMNENYRKEVTASKLKSEGISENDINNNDLIQSNQRAVADINMNTIIVSAEVHRGFSQTITKVDNEEQQQTSSMRTNKRKPLPKDQKREQDLKKKRCHRRSKPDADGRYPCKICNRRFKRPYLYVHQKQAHQKKQWLLVHPKGQQKSDSGNKFRCSWCNFVSIYWRTMLQHHYKQHQQMELDVVPMETDSETVQEKCQTESSVQ